RITQSGLSETCGVVRAPIRRSPRALAAFTGSSPDGDRNVAKPAAGVASVRARVPVQTLAIHYDLLRHRLGDGEQTTVYVVRYPRPQTSLSVQHFAVPQQLDRWCREAGVREAIVGG